MNYRQINKGNDRNTINNSKVLLMSAVPLIKSPLASRKLTFETLLALEVLIVVAIPRKSTAPSCVNVITLLFTALPSESLTLNLIVCVPVRLTNFI